jgi:hypothetical protein
MARIKKRKLSWQASVSSQVVGYKLYWSQGGSVDYESDCVQLGNVTEVLLPDDLKDHLKVGRGPVEFGVTAVDELGNESDMVTLTAPYQFSVPEAPAGFKMEAVKDFRAMQRSPSEAQTVQAKNVFKNELSLRHLKSV